MLLKREKDKVFTLFAEFQAEIAFRAARASEISSNYADGESKGNKGRTTAKIARPSKLAKFIAEIDICPDSVNDEDLQHLKYVASVFERETSSYSSMLGKKAAEIGAILKHLPINPTSETFFFEGPNRRMDVLATVKYFLEAERKPKITHDPTDDEKAIAKSRFGEIKASVEDQSQAAFNELRAKFRRPSRGSEAKPEQSPKETPKPVDWSKRAANRTGQLDLLQPNEGESKPPRPQPGR